MKKFSAISRIIALAVVLCLCSAFVPVMTFAETVDPGTITVITTDGKKLDALTDKAGDNEASTLAVGENGTVTYDADTATVTLNNVKAKSITFAMNGDFTVDLVGANSFSNNASKLFYVSKGNVRITGGPDGTGSLTVSGAAQNIFRSEAGNITFAGGTVTVDGNGNDNLLHAVAGNMTVDGGTVIVKGDESPVLITSGTFSLISGRLEIHATNCNALYAKSGDITIEGGELDISSSSYNVVHAKNIYISDGTVNVETTSSINNAGKGVIYGSTSINIFGGTLNVTSEQSRVIYTGDSAGTINITGGTINATGTIHVFRSKNINISEANPNVPTNITATATSGQVFSIANANVSGSSLNITGGKITGTSAKYFVAHYAGASSSLTIGADAILDFDVSVQPMDPTYSAGIISIADEALAAIFDANSGTKLKTANQRLKADAEVTATVTKNGVGQSGVTVGLYNEDGEQVAAGVTGENGVATLTVANLEAGYTYGYTLKQVIGEKINGYTYDETAKAVSIFINSDKTKITVNDGEAITFANTYTAAGTSATIDVTVNLTGKDLADDDFILVVNGKEMAVPADGKVALSYDYDKAGETTYTISLKKAKTNYGITLDTDEETVTVTVTDNGNGQLVANVDKTVTFDNTFEKQPGAVKIKAQINLTDKTFVASEFGLVLTGDTIDGEQVITVDENGYAEFSLIFTDAGEYTYTLAQTCSAQGVTLDSAKTFTVTALESDGLVVAVYTGGTIEFNNTYAAEVKDDVKVNVNVNVSSITLKEGDVTVTLKKGDQVIDTNNTIVEDGSIVLTIPADKVVDGEYTITVTSNVDGIDFTEATKTFKVTVTDNGDGTATVDPTETSVSFTGTYKIPEANGEIVADENGKLWYKVDDVATNVGLFVYTDGNIYCTDHNGAIVTGKYYAWQVNANCDLPTDWYYFGTDGVILNGICEHPAKEGKLYYFVNGQAKDQGGLFMIEDKYYFTEYDGEIKTGKWYVWQTQDGKYDSLKGWREFDETGAMKPVLEGIHEAEDGKLYYYVDGKPTDQGGLFELNSKYYFTEYNGEIKTGKWYVWQTQKGLESLKGWRYFGADGAALDGVCDHPDENKGLYYFENGKPTFRGLFLNEDDGFYYATEYDGMIITTTQNVSNWTDGKYYVWKLDESAKLSKGWYTFGADGRMIMENNRVYTLNIPNVAADYEGTPTSDGLYNVTAGYKFGAFNFNGKAHWGFSSEDVTSGLVTAPVYAYNDTDTAKYARSVFLFQATEYEDLLHYTSLGRLLTEVKDGDERVTINVDGVDYYVGYYVYTGQVEAGNITKLSVYQYFFDATLTGYDISDYKVKFINELSDTEFGGLTVEEANKLFGNN